MHVTAECPAIFPLREFLLPSISSSHSGVIHGKPSMAIDISKTWQIPNALQLLRTRD